MTKIDGFFEEIAARRQSKRDTPPARIVATAFFDYPQEMHTAVFDATVPLSDVLVWSQNLKDASGMATLLEPDSAAFNRPTRLLLTPDSKSLDVVG